MVRRKLYDLEEDVQDIYHVVDAWRDLTPLDPGDITALKSGSDPLWDFSKLWAKDGLASFIAREHACRRWSWCNLGPATPLLADFVCTTGVVEIGGGSGYVAALLAARGIDVLSFDTASTDWYGSRTGVFHPVELGGVEQAALFPERTLLLAWPPYDELMAFEALEGFIKVGGTRVAFIGERGGCNATEEFFALLDATFINQERVSVSPWPRIHDALWLCSR
jgi:hypothetical protein